MTSTHDKPLISFDYAMKYILRDKSDYSIIEGFLSALLATANYKPVKVKSLLETESNKDEERELLLTWLLKILMAYNI